VDDPSALRALADVVEPVKDYAREELAQTPATSSTPLNRLIDAARPESDMARQFSGMVDDFLAGKASDEIQGRMRTLLSVWRDTQTRLEPLEKNSALLIEVVPVSQNLSTLGTIGLQAMDYLSGGRPAPADWSTESLTLTEAAQKPQAQLLLVVAPSIEKLIRAAGKANAAKQ